MAALITWVCRVDHAAKRDEPVTALTIHRGEWAYCSRGVLDDCIWEAIRPTPVELLRALRGPSEATAEQRASQAAE